LLQATFIRILPLHQKR
ncbi:hypothetical protein VCHENC02_3793B, partial [Vibrio harveyi]